MRVLAVGVEPVGVVAIGANATGIIAIGQLATGVVAVGQLARGVVVVGQLAVGVLAFGQLALGVGWVGGMLAIGGRAGPGMLVLSPRSPRLRIGLVVVLAALWWVAAGSWLVGSITEESGIFRDEPPPSCDDAGRLC